MLRDEVRIPPWFGDGSRRDIREMGHHEATRRWLRTVGLCSTKGDRVSEPVRTVSQVVTRFEHEFVDFAASFVTGDYVLWLGSGISRDVVPNVWDLLSTVLETLRTNIDRSNPACPFRRALEEALDLASSPHDVIDLECAFDAWPTRDDILRVLTSRYAEVLDIQVDGQPSDYLVWTGLDVPNTYGDPALAPDVEHYCIALLMMEGVVKHAVTANWDGLIERALSDLTDVPDAVARVIVKSDDFRKSTRRADLIKFHGCAVCAREDEDAYRKLLVARQQQISGWTERRENQQMRKHLEVLHADHPSLVIGLSLQDANLHTMIARSIEELQRPWPQMPPAVVLAEEKLEPHHRHILRNTYLSAYDNNAAAIVDSALLGSYAKPTLLGLVVWSLSEKLIATLACVPTPANWAAEQTECLAADLRSLRDVAACHADSDSRAFIARLIEMTTLALAVFRHGRGPVGLRAAYAPLSDRPMSEALQNPDFPAEAFGQLAMIVALLARGVIAGDWTLGPGASSAADMGVATLTSTRGEVKVFLVKDTYAAVTLSVEGLADEGDVNTMIVQAGRESPRATRSPRARYGRVGRSRASMFSIEDVLAHSDTADDLYDAFRLAGGI